MKTCVVVALNEKTRDFVAASLKASEIEAVLLPSLGDLRVTLEKVSVCGILLELATAITASEGGRKDAQKLFGFSNCFWIFMLSISFSVHLPTLKPQKILRTPANPVGEGTLLLS